MFTLLVTGVLVVIFALMFALVQFSEAVITREKPAELPLENSKPIARNS
jgi:Na+-transporting methylmalonyl-CoA/oxaloacetate decarboxylase gamma subunit